MIRESGVAFDGPMWLAVHLNHRMELLNDVWLRDPRWTEENVKRFVPLLQKFYTDTRFDRFFSDNSDLYEETVKRFHTVYEQADIDWGFPFFGKEPAGVFSIKIGMGIGGNCYGVDVDGIEGSRHIYAVMGTGMTDQAGVPEFSVSADLPVLIHEFCHPFIDGLTEKHREIFRESGQKLFSTVKNVLSMEAYPSWEEVLNEALVNASMILYLKDHGFEPSEIDLWLKGIKDAFGIFWIEDLVVELEAYRQQRNKYPTLESYMPQLATAYQRWVE
jgi:hypothetical protein